MKKIYFILILFSLLAIHSEQVELIKEGAKQLDSNWANYYKTNNTKYIMDNLLVLNWEDYITNKINNKLVLKNENNKELIESLSELNITIDLNNNIHSKYDLDILFGRLLRDENYKSIIKKILLNLGRDEKLFLSMSIKSAAFWSLLSISKQREDVNGYIIKNKNLLNEKINLMLEQNL